MPETEAVTPEGERIRKAVRWICETVAEHPERDRKSIVQEAEIRFDLTPRECEFVHAKLTETQKG